jgi:hypothetical protein
MGALPVSHLTKESTMQTRSVVIVAALGLASFAHGQQAVQWRVEDGGNGHWYLYQSHSMTWPTARTNAQAIGADLASLESTNEWNWVRARLGFYFALVGARQDPGQTDPAGGWRWLTGGSVTQFSLGMDDNPCGTSPEGFEDGQQDFGELVYDGLGDINAGASPSCWDAGLRPSLVEWSADCNLDGIVDYGQCRDGSLSDYNGNNVPDCCEAGTPCTVGNYPIQWRVDDGGNGHWYLANRWKAPKSWELAKVAAEQRGGYLACITSEAENAWIFQHCNLAQPGCGLSQEGWHLGGFQDLGAPDYSEPAGGWRWISGEPWVYTAWLTNVPGGDRPNNFGPGGEQYLKMSELPYAPWWDDVGIGSSQQFMCGAIIEWSTDCNGDAIVDYGQILDGTFADTNENGVPDPCEVDPCPGDITGGGQVNGVDLAAILGAWGTDGQGKLDCDINDDGTVDAQDLAIVLGGWGNCP